MAGSLRTANYNLSKYAAGDVTSWLVDFNGNMDKIDAQMKANSNEIADASGEISTVKANVESLERNMGSLENDVTALETNAAVAEVITTASSNVSRKITRLYKTGKLIQGTIYWFINKTGDTVSTIDIGDESSKLVPILLLTGNPFNLPVVNNPTGNDLNYVGELTNAGKLSSETDLFCGAVIAYYNGTNTVIGFTVANTAFVNSYIFINGVGSISYLAE